MVRLGRLTAALSVATLLAALPAVADAQALQRLSVIAFSLGSDTPTPGVNIPFHLIVTLRVRERVTQIENLELPLLAELELLGDVRTLTASAGGTLYRESIAVVAHHAGTLTIGSALLQAIDPHDRRAKQYATNGLSLAVAGAAPSLSGVGDAARNVFLALLRVLLWIAGTACALVLVIAVFRRRRPVAPAPPPAPEPIAPATPPPVGRSTRDRLQDALTVLQAQPTRESAVRVRALVWGMLGAAEGETLADVLTRAPAQRPLLGDLLRGLERAAFTYDADVATALEAARAALQRILDAAEELL